MKKYKLGYTTGVFDMFHIGHLNILRRAKEQCEYLIVGVTTDELCKKRKNKLPIINEHDRMAIVEAIRYVDKVIPQTDMDKLSAVKQLNADVVFVGSDRKGTEAWNKYEKDFASVGCTVEYLDHTDDLSGNTLCERIAPVGENIVIGYTTGVYDMFHIGHLNILKRAKEHCDYLIVGVSTDENVQSYKHKSPKVPYVQRLAIVSSIKYVDEVVPQENMDKYAAWERLHFDEIYHGDDWKGSTMFNEVECKLSEVGCKMVFLPHTDGISSTILQEKISK